MKCNTVFISSLCYHLFFCFSISNFFQSLLQRFLFSTFSCLHSIILHAILLFSNCNVSLYVRPWRRKAVPSEILVKRLYISDCKTSLAFFVPYLLFDVLKFFAVLAGRWKCSGKGKRLGYERSGFGSGLRSISFSVAKILSVTVQKRSKIL